MKRFRTTSWFVHVLVGLFLVAQLAGVVSSPRANAEPGMDAGMAHSHQDHVHHHDGSQVGSDTAHHHGGNLADTCCALHAYFAGVMPPAVAVGTAAIVGVRLAARPDDQSTDVPPGRLDRPPRSLH